MGEGARVAAAPRTDRSFDDGTASLPAPAAARRRSPRALAPARPSIRVPELLLGVLLVAGCALAAVIWQQSASTTREALVFARDVTRGEVLGPADFAAAHVRATGARLLPFKDADRLVGRVAAADLSALTPVTDDLAVETVPLGADESLVGRRLALGQFPSGLKSGDHVVVVLIDAPTTQPMVLPSSEEPALAEPIAAQDVDTAPQSLTAVVESMVAIETGAGDVVATLRVPASHAARLAAVDDVRLAQVPVVG